MPIDDSSRIPVNRKLLTRFFSKVRIDPSVTFRGVPCWLWTSQHCAQGYGRLQFNGSNLNAHNIAFGMFVHRIPKGHHADHLCRNRGCVNPVHVDDVPPRINILRGKAPAARHAIKTHCDNGHEFTPENTRHPKRNPSWRECRACMKQSAERHRIRQRKKLS